MDKMIGVIIGEIVVLCDTSVAHTNVNGIDKRPYEGLTKIIIGCNATANTILSNNVVLILDQR